MGLVVLVQTCTSIDLLITKKSSPKTGVTYLIGYLNSLDTKLPTVVVYKSPAAIKYVPTKEH